jgi:hypothetical protein
MAEERSQQLYAVNTTVNVADNLLARVKDPLWFLAVQWRTGEFEAENGGRLAHGELTAEEHDLVRVTRGGDPSSVDLDHPLELAVEAEDSTGSPAWRSAALEYTFEVSTSAHELVASEYAGSHLDWYHFDLAGRRDSPPDRELSAHVLPDHVRIRGAPHPRWWRFEDSRDALHVPSDPEPNVLSTLLTEFSLIDVDNWFVAPVRQRAGSVREVTAVEVTDSFGVRTSLGPAVDSWGPNAWGTFVLDGDEDVVEQADGRFLFVPNIALEVLHNDDVEEVRFLRDEEANLVWACERLVRADDGSPIYNGDGESQARAGSAGPASAGLPRYVLADQVPHWWIPYVPRRLDPSGAADGEIYLRRARTTEDPADIQYRSQLVAESWRLDEHEVPRTGLRVRRVHRYARGSDGQALFWIGRQKDTSAAIASPSLRFDRLEE